MAKGNQIQKLVNGEIADADDVNQIVEDAGSEGGTIPYDPTSHERSTDGTQSLGSTAYPWGSLKINREAELVEVDPVSHTVAASIAIKDLRNFIQQKDTPASYTGEAGKFPAVNSGESALEFVNSPSKSNVFFQNPNEFIATTPGESYDTMWQTKFIKVAGVTTVTVWAQLKHTGAETRYGTLKCLIGSVYGTVNMAQPVAGNSYAWYYLNVDVSSLTNGTTYDVSIQLKMIDGGGDAYVKDLISFGD